MSDPKEKQTGPAPATKTAVDRRTRRISSREIRQLAGIQTGDDMPETSAVIVAGRVTSMREEKGGRSAYYRFGGRFEARGPMGRYVAPVLLMPKAAEDLIASGFEISSPAPYNFAVKLWMEQNPDDRPGSVRLVWVVEPLLEDEDEDVTGELFEQILRR